MTAAFLIAVVLAVAFLLHRRPTYAELLQDPRWKKRRAEIIKRDHRRCRTCGNRHRLQVHHRAYIRFLGFRPSPWFYPDYYLITLCSSCHAQEHGI